MIKWIAEYVGKDYKQVGDIVSTLENEVRFTIPQPKSPDIITTTTANNFDTMMFKMEVNVYVKQKSMLKENMQKSYALMLGQCTELLKSKLNKIIGWS